MNLNNEYFLKMDEVYQLKSAERLKRRKAKSQEDSMTQSFSRGAWNAYYAVYFSEAEDEVLVDTPFEEDTYADFIKTMKKFGFRSFVITYDGAGFFNDLYMLLSAGCRLEGVTRVVRKAEKAGLDRDRRVRGFRISMPLELEDIE